MRILIPALILVLAGCGEQQPANPSSPVDAVRQAAETAAAKTPPQSAALQPGQSVQGMIEADVGKGTQSFRSLSTKVADDLDKQIEEKLRAGEGQRALNEANRTLRDSGVKQEVNADQVRDFISGMAGKTFHDSVVQHIGMIHQLNVTLGGTAADGTKLSLDLNFDDTSLQLKAASLTYTPDPRAMFDSYRADDDAPPQVTIERFEKNPDGSYALAGSFRAQNVPASPMARKIKGKTLASAEGLFAFEALPFRELNLGGVKR
ncbi:MAG: hypothetical protein R3F04_02930 [Lysobacteraceae bacterium]